MSAGGLVQIAGLVLPLVALVIWAQESWNGELDRASALASKNAAVVREYVLRTIQTAESALTQVDLQTQGLSSDAIGTRAVHTMLKQIDDAADVPWGIAIADENGRLRNSSLVFPLDASVADRDYFIAVRDGLAPLFIGERIRTRVSNEDAIPIARRRSGDPFTGIIAANVKVSTLVEFFEKLTADKRTTVSLLRMDGAQLARWPLMDPRRLGADSPFMRYLANGKAEDVYRAVAASDQVERIYAYARVGDLPMVVTYGLSIPGIAAHWRQNLYVATAIAALCALLLIGAGGHLRTMQRQRDGLVAEVKSRTAELESALADKEVLLREVHHRVKNNLAMTAGMVRIVARTTPPETQPAFQDIARRVTTIGQLYEHVYQADKVSALDLGAYLGEICRKHAISFGMDQVRLRTELQSVIVDIDTALPVGLIAGELVTNAYKHAFSPGRSGEILVRFEAHGGVGVLTVRDNGRGLGEDNDGRSTGLRLAEALAGQVDGRLRSKTRPQGGAQFRLTFKVRRKQRDAA